MSVSLGSRFAYENRFIEGQICKRYQQRRKPDTRVISVIVVAKFAYNHDYKKSNYVDNLHIFDPEAFQFLLFSESLQTFLVLYKNDRKHFLFSFSFII